MQKTDDGIYLRRKTTALLVVGNAIKTNEEPRELYCDLLNAEKSVRKD
jgi:hypothetical protein